MSDSDEIERGTDPLDGADDTYRLVLLEDLSVNPSGDFPGADIDAVSLIKANGDEFFAQAVVDSDISCTGNLSCDPLAMLGSTDVVDPDLGECFGGGGVTPELFTALNGGWAIFEFSSADNGDVVIENGDKIHVYEIGATECGRYDDDPFSVSVGFSGDSDFVNLGDYGYGTGAGNEALVSGL